jgi:hypothetical protein
MGLGVGVWGRGLLPLASSPKSLSTAPIQIKPFQFAPQGDPVDSQDFRRLGLVAVHLLDDPGDVFLLIGFQGMKFPPLKPMARAQAANPKITFWRIFRYKRFLQADKMSCGPAPEPENRGSPFSILASVAFCNTPQS